MVGENNSGKSSLLQALMLVSSGTRLQPHHFHVASEPIRIALTIEGISAGDLDRLSVEHRPRVEEIVEEGRLVLVRLYDPDGKSSLRCHTTIPADLRFSDSSVSALLKGKRAGASLVGAVEGCSPS